MTKDRARTLIAHMDSEIERRFDQYQDVEDEIQYLWQKRQNFIKRHAKVFSQRELIRIRTTF